MKKIFISLTLAILIIGSTYAGNSTVTINDIDFDLPSKYHGGEMINGNYKLENVFSICCIDDDISKFIGLWATENDFSENVMIGDHPVRHYYSYNEYVHNNMSHAYFASEDSIYEIKWMGEEITPDIEKLIKNTPASKIDKDTFYNTLDESIDMYKEQKIVKLNQDSEYNYLEAKHQSQSSPQNTHDDTKFNRILLTYYNRWDIIQNILNIKDTSTIAN